MGEIWIVAGSTCSRSGREFFVSFDITFITYRNRDSFSRFFRNNLDEMLVTSNLANPGSTGYS
ncbi:hypothetical protein GMO_19180 [Gluconobacter morbifer G707]|uniref:Uncharacterized protein n=1 Tax=Gluconobacter morbifer G707 TaxID=1088869 RepID=G6XKA2_9PROT|nr:hypothetical protein GMO_19180 [Gluconobacter morbifer G707]